jgi:hypothetical protein
LDWVASWKSKAATQATTPVNVVKKSTLSRRSTTTTATTTEEPETTEEGEEPLPTRPKVQGGPLTEVEACVFNSNGLIINVPGLPNDCFGYCKNGKFLTAFVITMSRMACCCK